MPQAFVKTADRIYENILNGVYDMKNEVGGGWRQTDTNAHTDTHKLRRPMC